MIILVFFYYARYFSKKYDKRKLLVVRPKTERTETTTGLGYQIVHKTK